MKNRVTYRFPNFNGAANKSRWNVTSSRWLFPGRMRRMIPVYMNTLGPRQNGRHFADDIFKCISLNENSWILNKISLKYVPWGLINNMATLVRIMAWRRTGDKSLSEAMLVYCIDAYMRHSASMSYMTLLLLYRILHRLHIVITHISNKNAYRKLPLPMKYHICQNAYYGKHILRYHMISIHHKGHTGQRECITVPKITDQTRDGAHILQETLSNCVCYEIWT